MARARPTKATVKARESGPGSIQKSTGKAKVSATPRGRPSKKRLQASIRTSTALPSSEVNFSRDFSSPIRTIYDADQIRKYSGPYHADDEESIAPPRRFSDLYGHGRPLEPEGQVALTPGTKRRLSSGASQPSPKKVRFNPEHNETRQIQKDRIRSLPVSPVDTSIIAHADSVRGSPINEHDNAPALTTNPAQLLLEGLPSQPEFLGLTAIAALFRTLQSQTKSFGDTWFGFNKHDVRNLDGEHNRTNFPLRDLELTYPALYWTAVNVVDTPANNPSQAWLKFFTRSEPRQALVYAILGEWLSQRVFNDTSFGLNEEFKREMRESVDIKYLHYDSFVRAKKRAKLVQHAFESGERQSNLEALEKASSELAEELMIVLAPLLPTWRVSDPFGEAPSPAATAWRTSFRSELINLIQRAAGLNLSLIRSGENGTVVRIAPKLARGREYSELAPMECINKDEIERVATTKPNAVKDAKLMVKMTCWARVEAYVPHGMDREEMEEHQQILMAKEVEDIVLDAKRHGFSPTKRHFEKSYKKFCWDCVDPEAFPEIPKDLWKQAKVRQDKQEMLMSFAKIDKLPGQESAQEGGGDDHSSDSSTDSGNSLSGYGDLSSSSHGLGISYAHKDEQQAPPRGSWVTIYDCLTPHQVYCEWTKPADGHGTHQRDGVRMGGDEIQKFNTLQAVVRAARDSSSSPLVKMDDFMIRIWNLYASKNVWIEWMPLLAFAIYLGRDRFPTNLTGTSDSLKSFVLARFTNARDMAEHVVPGLVRFLKADWNGTMLAKIFEKMREVIPMPSAITDGSEIREHHFGLFSAGRGAAFRAAISSAMAGFIPWPVLPPFSAEGSEPALPLTADEN